MNKQKPRALGGPADLARAIRRTYGEDGRRLLNALRAIAYGTDAERAALRSTGVGERARSPRVPPPDSAPRAAFA